jgi:hypothetical protein
VSVLPAWLYKATHMPPDEAQQLGRTTLRTVQALVSAPEEGVALWTRFRQAGSAARASATPHTVREVYEAAADLEKSVAPLLAPDELLLFREEIGRDLATVRARANSAGVPMPSSARFRRILADTDRVPLSVATARYEDSFLQRLETSASGELAFGAHRQMRVLVRDQGQAGWGRVFNYCAKNKPGIARAAPGLRAAHAAYAASPPTAATRRLLNIARKRSGYFYPIRGELAELYVSFWPVWRDQRDALIDLATISRDRLGRGWKVHPFQGGALIDGKKAWDEGILLLKSPSASDQQARAILHTAVQVKAQARVESLLQTIKDRTRERGVKPVLTLLDDNLRRKLLLESPLPGEEVIRYVFHARGGTLSHHDIARLKSVGIEVTAQPLAMSLEEFDALTLEIILAAL